MKKVELIVMNIVLKSSIIIVVLIISIFSASLFSGCTNKYEKIYNDDSLIISYNSYGNSNYTKNNSKDRLTVSSSSFSGVETLIFAFTVDSDTYATIHVSYPLAGAVGGKIKVVLANNNNVYSIASCGQLSDGVFITENNEEVDFKNIPNGVYNLKIVGVNANFEMVFSY